MMEGGQPGKMASDQKYIHLSQWERIQLSNLTLIWEEFPGRQLGLASLIDTLSSLGLLMPKCSLLETSQEIIPLRARNR